MIVEPKLYMIACLVCHIAAIIRYDKANSSVFSPRVLVSFTERNSKNLHKILIVNMLRKSRKSRPNARPANRMFWGKEGAKGVG